MSEDNPHERDVTLAKEKEEAEQETDEAEEAREAEAERKREEAAEGEVEVESEQREEAAREVENPDNHRDEPPPEQLTARSNRPLENEGAGPPLILRGRRPRAPRRGPPRSKRPIHRCRAATARPRGR